MAIVTNTFQTYQAIGDREDLTDIIYNISPTDTPMMSSIGKEKARCFKSIFTTYSSRTKTTVWKLFTRSTKKIGI